MLRTVTTFFHIARECRVCHECMGVFGCDVCVGRLCFDTIAGLLWQTRSITLKQCSVCFEHVLPWCFAHMAKVHWSSSALRNILNTEMKHSANHERALCAVFQASVSHTLGFQSHSRQGSASWLCKLLWREDCPVQIARFDLNAVSSERLIRVMWLKRCCSTQRLVALGHISLRETQTPNADITTKHHLYNATMVAPHMAPSKMLRVAKLT